MSRPGEGKGVIVLVALLALGLGGLALWLAKQDEAPTQVPVASTPAPAPTPLEPPRAATPPPEPPAARTPTPAKPPTKVQLPAKLEQQRDTSERMRSEIRESLASRPSDPAGAAAPSDEPPTLDKDYIRSRIREDLIPVAVECYESVLAEQPDAGGKIVMSFAILGDPEVGGVVDEAAVDDAQSDFDNAFLRECMQESLMAVHFDAPPEGGRVEVTYPFVFEPGED